MMSANGEMLVSCSNARPRKLIIAAAGRLAVLTSFVIELQFDPRNVMPLVKRFKEGRNFN